MQKIAVINHHLLNVRNKVSDLYRKNSPDLFKDNKAIQQNDDLLATTLRRSVDDTNPYK
jgi:hypothetical protein